MIGNGGVGKTYLRRLLMKYLTKNTAYTFSSLDKDKGIFKDDKSEICIIDDVNINDVKCEILKEIFECKKILYFDYRALDYLAEKNIPIDTIFYFQYDINSRFNNRENFYSYDRSPMGIYKHTNHIQRIYNIMKHNDDDSTPQILKELENLSIEDKPEVTLIITSCNRNNLLSKTLCSFAKFNTYPIKECIIVEDSSFILDISRLDIPHLDYPIRVISNRKNIGQVRSIDRAYAEVKTPYIFHCEDDW